MLLILAIPEDPHLFSDNHGVLKRAIADIFYPVQNTAFQMHGLTSVDRICLIAVQNFTISFDDVENFPTIVPVWRVGALAWTNF
jgi:hypothetical protein